MQLLAVLLVVMGTAYAAPAPGFYPGLYPGLSSGFYPGLYGGLLPYQRSLLLKKAALGLVGNFRSPFSILAHLEKPTLTIHRKVGVPVLKTVHVPYDKPVPVVVKKKVPVFYDAPYPVKVVEPVPHYVDKPVHVPVDAPYPVAVHKDVPVPYVKDYPVAVSAPLSLKEPLDVSLTPEFTSGDVTLSQSEYGWGKK